MQLHDVNFYTTFGLGGKEAGDVWAVPHQNPGTGDECVIDRELVYDSSSVDQCAICWEKVRDLITVRLLKVRAIKAFTVINQFSWNWGQLSIWV